MNPSQNSKKILSLLLAIIITGFLAFGFMSASKNNKAKENEAPQKTTQDDDLIKVQDNQLKDLDIGPVGSQAFEQKRQEVGMIDFNQDHTVSVFSPYQGKIKNIYVKAGDQVKAGQPLFTVEIPDLAQASSNLISTAGILKLANETLARAQDLYTTKTVSLKELEQNTSDQQTAKANYLAALKSMRLFGLKDEDIAKLLASKKIDIEMPVKSPIDGKIVSRSAAPGVLVQPGNAPAPVVVSNTTQLWMIASVPESETALYHIGQNVEVTTQAYQNKSFQGNISYIADAVDSDTHRIAIRANINDPKHELKAQMLANFTITLGEPIHSVAVPTKAIARENNSSYSVWVTSDQKTFKRRTVKIGITQNNYIQIIEGLNEGEVIARDKGLFLSNLYATMH
jgi:cobalt-zinc-cadmium efflux system membrane fusion protein